MGELSTIRRRHSNPNEIAKENAKVIGHRNAVRKKMEMHVQYPKIQNSFTRQKTSSTEGYAVRRACTGNGKCVQVPGFRSAEKYELEKIQSKSIEQSDMDYHEDQGDVSKKQQNHDKNNGACLEYVGETSFRVWGGDMGFQEVAGGGQITPGFWQVFIRTYEDIIELRGVRRPRVDEFSNKEVDDTAKVLEKIVDDEEQQAMQDDMD